MKTIITAALLLAVNLYAFSQITLQPKPGGELHIGYFREYIKLRDKQVSPMLYVANLNGLRVAYNRVTPKNQWLADIRVSTADIIAPGLGIRKFKFSEDQQQPLLLVPTLYRAELAFTYRRLLQQNSYRSSRAGVSIQETFNYADGIALTTWVMNSLALHLSYQTQIHLNESHTIVAEASIPVLAAVSRLPYSNVVSKPEKANSKAFLQNTNFESVNRYLNPQVSVGYRFDVSKRLAMQAMYRYNWLRYPEPRLIRSASHTGNLSFIYLFQFQTK